MPVCDMHPLIFYIRLPHTDTTLLQFVTEILIKSYRIQEKRGRRALVLIVLAKVGQTVLDVPDVRVA